MEKTTLKIRSNGMMRKSRRKRRRMGVRRTRKKRKWKGSRSRGKEAS